MARRGGEQADDGAWWHFDDGVAPASPGAVSTASMATIFGFVMGREFQGIEVIHVRIHS
jgi:hypothetical protein